MPVSVPVVLCAAVAAGIIGLAVLLDAASTCRHNQCATEMCRTLRCHQIRRRMACQSKIDVDSSVYHSAFEGCFVVCRTRAKPALWLQTRLSTKVSSAVMLCGCKGCVGWLFVCGLELPTACWPWGRLTLIGAAVFLGGVAGQHNAKGAQFAAATCFKLHSCNPATACRSLQVGWLLRSCAFRYFQVCIATPRMIRHTYSVCAPTALTLRNTWAFLWVRGFAAP